MLHAKSLQSCPTLCDPMGCSPPGSSLHGILQAGILEWVAFPPPGGLPNPGIEPGSPALSGAFFSTEPCGKLVRLYCTALIILPCRQVCARCGQSPRSPWREAAPAVRLLCPFQSQRLLSGCTYSCESCRDGTCLSSCVLAK